MGHNQVKMCLLVQMLKTKKGITINYYYYIMEMVAMVREKWALDAQTEHAGWLVKLQYLTFTKVCWFLNIIIKTVTML